MRLIDADDIRYDRLLKTGKKYDPLEWAASRTSIDATPTIDPVKHGNWVSKNGWVSCSVCGLEPPNETNEASDYCPNCGARMDEPKTISAEFAKLMIEGEIQVRWKRETD